MLGSLPPLLTLKLLCSPSAETPPCSDDFLSWKQPGTKVFYLFVSSTEIAPGQEKTQVTSAEIDISAPASTLPLVEVPDSDV